MARSNEISDDPMLRLDAIVEAHKPNEKSRSDEESKEAYRKDALRDFREKVAR